MHHHKERRIGGGGDELSRMLDFWKQTHWAKGDMNLKTGLLTYSIDILHPRRT